MADILHDFPINGLAGKIFEAVSTPAGLDAWWTKRCTGQPKEGAEYQLWFGPRYDWRAVVCRCFPDKEFELEILRADKDWLKSCVGFALDEKNGLTRLRFHQKGWPESNEHHRVSSF